MKKKEKLMFFLPPPPTSWTEAEADTGESLKKHFATEKQ